MHTRVLAAFLMGSGLFGSAVCRAQPAPPRSEEVSGQTFYALSSLSNPQFSPDGKLLLVVGSKPAQESNTFDRTLLLLDVATHHSRTLVRTRGDLSFPRWSPAGDRVAYLGSDPRGTPQIMICSLPTGEIRQLTHHPLGVQQFVWRPGTGDLVYTAWEEPEAQQPRELGWEAGNHRFPLGKPALLAHLWALSSDGGTPKRLTSGTWTVAQAFPPSLALPPLSVSPDGRELLYTRSAAPYSAEVFQSSVQVLDLSSAQSRPVTTADSGEMNRSYSPDGRHLELWVNGELQSMPTPSAHGTPALPGTGQAVSPELSWHVQTAVWMPGSDSMILAANDRDTVSFWLQPLGGQPQKLDLQGITPIPTTTRDGSPMYLGVDLTVGPHGELAFVGSTPTQPAELYAMASPTAAPVRVTEVNRALDHLRLGRQETLSWATADAQGTPDGMEDNGVLTFPPGAVPGRSYPVLVMVHGGPGFAAFRTFNLDAQRFAANGWIVFEPNYRGSDNLTPAFANAINNDAIVGPCRDIMAGLALLRTRGLLSGKTAVFGTSYGGTLSAALLGLYPSQWAAGVVGSAILDWTDEYYLSDSPWWAESTFGFPPDSAEHRNSYIAQSPVTFAGKVQAPTLLLSNLGDSRAPHLESLRFWELLRQRGTTTSLIVSPIAGHSAVDPAHLQDVRDRSIAWLKTYLH